MYITGALWEQWFLRLPPREGSGLSLFLLHAWASETLTFCQWGGSVDRGTCCQTWCPMLHSWDPHGRRREETPQCFPLTFTCELHMHVYTKYEKVIKIKKWSTYIVWFVYFAIGNSEFNQLSVAPHWADGKNQGWKLYLISSSGLPVSLITPDFPDSCHKQHKIKKKNKIKSLEGMATEVCCKGI